MIPRLLKMLTDWCFMAPLYVAVSWVDRFFLRGVLDAQPGRRVLHISGGPERNYRRIVPGAAASAACAAPLPERKRLTRWDDVVHRRSMRQSCRRLVPDIGRPVQVAEEPDKSRRNSEGECHMIIIIHGPQGCGKTRHGETLKAHFGCTALVDDWRDGDALAEGTLALTQTPPTQPPAGSRVLPFAEACAEAGI